MGIIHKNHHDNHGGVLFLYDTHPTLILRFQMGFLYAKFWNSFLEACTWLEISVLEGFFKICFKETFEDYLTRNISQCLPI
jgi:hypothetical protein